MGQLQIERLQQSDRMIEFFWTDTGDQFRLLRDEEEIYKGRDTSWKEDNLLFGELYTYTLERLDSEGQMLERLKMQTGTENRDEDCENVLQQIVLTTIVSNDQIILAWGSIHGINEYEIYRNGELLDRIQATQYTDRTIKRDQPYTYWIRAKRPLQKSEVTLSEEKFTLAYFFGMLNWKSTREQADMEEFGLTKKIGRLDQLLGHGETSKEVMLNPEWRLLYQTFLPDTLLPNPNLLSPNRFFEGDGRDFDPHSKNYRTKVEFSIHLNDDATLFDYEKDVGTSIAYNWRKKFRKAGVASAHGIELTQVDENERKASISLTHSVGNPLTTAPNIDYNVYATFYRNGHYDIIGIHDQSPNHEVYMKKAEDAEWELIHKAESKGLAWMSTAIASQYWRISNFE